MWFLDTKRIPLMRHKLNETTPMPWAVHDAKKIKILFYNLLSRPIRRARPERHLVEILCKRTTAPSGEELQARGTMSADLDRQSSTIWKSWFNSHAKKISL